MLPPCWFWRRAQGYPLLHFDLVWDRCCVFPAAKCFWETLTILSHCWYFSTTFAFMSLGFHVNAVQWIEGLLTTSNFAHLGELSELHSLPSENKKRAFCEKRQNGANCVVRPFAKLAYFTAYICDRRAYIPKCSAHKDGYHFVPLNNHQPPHPIHTHHCRTCKQLAFLQLPCVGNAEIQFSVLLLVSNPSCWLGGFPHWIPPRNKIWPVRTC